MSGMKISEINLGDKASFQKTITETDVCLFAGITGDFNPIHINEIEANRTRFKKRLVHGILTSGLISAVIGTKLPGIGTIYLSQDLKFVKPVYINDTICATVSVKEVKIDKNIVVLETICINQNDEIVINGEAVVMPPI